MNLLLSHSLRANPRANPIIRADELKTTMIMILFVFLSEKKSYIKYLKQVLSMLNTKNTYLNLTKFQMLIIIQVTSVNLMCR